MRHKLRLDDLEVESFRTTEAPSFRGTVKGQANDADAASIFIISICDSCDGSCAPVHTCVMDTTCAPEHTCNPDATCAPEYTCKDSCHCTVDATK